jgi:hypothetical protein
VSTKQEFETELRHRFDLAEASGKSNIEVTAGDLHRAVGGYPGRNDRIPSCCDVMKAAMKDSRDEVTATPPGGRGATFQVRYVLPRPLQTQTRTTRTQSATSGRKAELSNSSPSRTAGKTRRALVQERLQRLTGNFDHYLDWYDKHVPFRSVQLNSHLETIRRRNQLDTAVAAATDSAFCRNLYRTLQTWGIGQRGSRLVSESDFEKALASVIPQLEKFDDITIDGLTSNAEEVTAKLWALMESLAIVENKSRLVPCSKTLHHLLTDLVVPIDREYTRTFFGLYTPEFQGHGLADGQRSVFTRIFGELIKIARTTDPASHIKAGRPWRTSTTKIIDNALVGFCMAEGLSRPS